MTWRIADQRIPETDVLIVQRRGGSSSVEVYHGTVRCVAPSYLHQWAEDHW
jgi:hypothetical protein